jgi:hypothetical protein
MKTKIRLVSSLLVLIIILSSIQVNAVELTNTAKLKGVVYQNKIVVVKEKKDMKATLQLETIRAYSDSLSFTGTLNYNGSSYNVNTRGKIFSSNAPYMGDSSLTVLLTPSKDIEFLSCIIEKNANTETLLPANKDIKELTVIKIAMRNVVTNEIIYIEDILPEKISFENLYSLRNKTDVDVSEDLSLQENWFLRYMQSYAVQEDSVKVASGLDCITNSLKDNNVFSVKDAKGAISNDNELDNGMPRASAVSPVTNISADAFKIVGSYYYTSSDAYGYYRITYEYPYGTGNRITQLIKWNTITNAPVPGGANGVANLSIEVEAEYYYIESSDTIEIFDHDSHLRIKNPTVQLALLTGNSDIITRVEKNVTCNGSSVSINWKSWLGLVPYGSTFVKFYNLVTSVQFIQESQTSNVLTFYDRIADSLAAWGKVHKDYKLDIPSNKYLSVEGDKVDLSVGIRKPVDASSYYTYVTGAKKAAYQFDCEIYSHDGFFSYSVLEFTLSKDIYRTYY